MIDISDLDKAAVLAALYNRARPVGMGWLHYSPADMTLEQARALLAESVPGFWYFDYIWGRCLKIDLTGDTLNPRPFDREYGDGAAEEIIKGIRP